MVNGNFEIQKSTIITRHSRGTAELIDDIRLVNFDF